MDHRDGDWRELNRAMWDERVPIHLASRFYDVTGFKSGRSSLRPFEVGEVGSVSGKDLLHLQCHFGMDTLSWARLGARVTGVDFSSPAVEAARRLAAEASLDATFVCADVYSAPAALGRRFDVVYTGIGALIWLPDIVRWAGVVAQLLEPGGVLYLVEVHPLIDVFADATLDVEHEYFHDPAGTVFDGAGSYADPDARTRRNRSVEWRHPLGDVVSALVDAGLRIELLREHDFTVYARWPFLEQRADGYFHFPPSMKRLPLLYSLRARLPGPGSAVG
jgi:SAM-dependent methyltransferase